MNNHDKKYEIHQKSDDVPQKHKSCDLNLDTPRILGGKSVLTFTLVTLVLRAMLECVVSLTVGVTYSVYA